MRFKTVTEELGALRFIYDRLDLQTGIGRNLLLQTKMLRSENEIKIELNKLNKIVLQIENDLESGYFDKLKNLLRQTRNINQSIKNIFNSHTPDDVQLYEIKHFAMLSEEIRVLTAEFKNDFISFHSLTEVVQILDPDATGISHFYIFSSYDLELNECRKLQNKYLKEDNPEKAEEYRLKSNEREDIIREKIANKLKPFCNKLDANLNLIAELDVLLAKAFLSINLNFIRPQISGNKTSYIGLFNPQIHEVLSLEGKSFQPVDINILPEPCIITGANMTGKTVLLKSIALSQYLFQFGFNVPAKKAAICPVDFIFLSAGEKEKELSGLSSFATEIKVIDNIIRHIRQKHRILALVDELARTTNPNEGKAIISACIEIFSENNVLSIITTHYSGITNNCIKLRVKGLTDSVNNEHVTIDNLNNYIDYTLVESSSEKVPSEAIRIAEILDVDSELISKSRNYLSSSS